MGKNRGEKPNERDEQRPRTPEGDSEEGERTERQEPGAGGLSKAEYDEATEKAVKDIHG